MAFKNYRNKRILVTGHTGFKGSWLSLWLLKLGADVTGYALTPSTRPSLFETLKLDASLRHIVGDIRDYGKLQNVVREYKPEVIFHLAAQAIVRDCYDDPKLAFDVNVGGTVNVLEAARDLGSVGQIVIVTTDKVYENCELKTAFQETDRLGGEDPYSGSKAGAELAVHAYTSSYFRKPGQTAIASARAGNVIGGGDWSNHRLVPDCVRALEQGETLQIRSPQAVRPWQHVLESLSGYLTLGEALQREPEKHRGQAYNFGPNSGHHKTVEELLSEARLYWPNLKWSVDPSTIGDKKEAQYLQLDCTKAQRQLAWQTRMTFTESVQLTAEWYAAHLTNAAALRDLTERQLKSVADGSNSAP